MAKASARAKAPPKGQAAAKGKAADSKRSRGPKLWVKVLALVILFPFAAVLLPTTLVFFLMMAPTWVAYMTDRSRDKSLVITVGMLNFAGTLPAIIELWTRGQSHQMAMILIGDVFVWMIAYGAACGGWLIFGFMPNLVGSYYRMTTDSRMKGLVKQQKALIAQWGRAVAEGIAPAEGGEADDTEEDGEAAEGDAEITEAELVPPRRAR
ncbi:MAG: hypothetical protein ACFCUT_03590 [Kiloniellaceae bacterium]